DYREKPIDIKYSDCDNKLETSPPAEASGLSPREEGAGVEVALRLCFRQIRGIREEDINVIMDARRKFYTSINGLRDINVPQAALEKLADADAFRSIELDRRQALWEISTCNDLPVALFSGQPSESAEEKVVLPKMSL